MPKRKKYTLGGVGDVLKLLHHGPSKKKKNRARHHPRGRRRSKYKEEVQWIPHLGAVATQVHNKQGVGIGTIKLNSVKAPRQLF